MYVHRAIFFLITHLHVSGGKINMFLSGEICGSKSTPKGGGAEFFSE
jgi:hypothetical protein